MRRHIEEVIINTLTHKVLEILSNIYNSKNKLDPGNLLNMFIVYPKHHHQSQVLD